MDLLQENEYEFKRELYHSDIEQRPGESVLICLIRLVVLKDNLLNERGRIARRKYPDYPSMEQDLNKVDDRLTALKIECARLDALYDMENTELANPDEGAAFVWHNKDGVKLFCTRSFTHEKILNREYDRAKLWQEVAQQMRVGARNKPKVKDIEAAVLKELQSREMRKSNVAASSSLRRHYLEFVSSNKHLFPNKE